MPPQSRHEFEIAIICALPLEADAVEALFDEDYNQLGHTYGKHAGDANTYTTGRIHNHDVVLAYMPGMGNRRSASVARGLLVSFPGIKLTLLVGICGGVPYSLDGTEIVLGDIIIGDSVIEYDFGRQYPHGFERKSGVTETLGSPNQEIQSFLSRLRTRRMRSQVQRHTAQYLQILQEMEDNEWSYPGVSHDTLFEASYRHKHYQQRYPIECICVGCYSKFDAVCEQALKSDCMKIGCAGHSVQRRRLNADCPAPFIHIGTIASSSSVMKSGEHRDILAEKEGVIGFEMEGAGVWDVLPCVIIKGVCDYADSHKNRAWQNYAAATAASCAKGFLGYWEGGFQHQQHSSMNSELLPPSQNLVKPDSKAHKTQTAPAYLHHAQPPQGLYMNEEDELVGTGRFGTHRNAYGLNNCRQNDIHCWCSTCGTGMHHTEECPWLGKDYLRCRRCRQFGHFSAECEPHQPCKKCRSKGHSARECLHPRGCYICGQYDHWANDCRWKKTLKS